jgi:oligosaccharyltransferase complex subunit delta (ribophorin II)
VCANSVEETYEELRTFEVLGIDKRSDISTAACQSVSEILGSSSSTLKDLFYALKVNGILKCDIKEDVFEVSFCSVLFFFLYLFQRY